MWCGYRFTVYGGSAACERPEILRDCAKSCGKCGALHGMSYAEGGSIPVGKQMPYPGATDRSSRWVQMSEGYVWENSLL